MATYASTTNPFLNASSSRAGSNKPAMKEAPGKAKPKEVDLLIAENEEQPDEKQLFDYSVTAREPKLDQHGSFSEQIVNEVSEILNELCVDLSSTKCETLMHTGNQDTGRGRSATSLAGNSEIEPVELKGPTATEQDQACASSDSSAEDDYSDDDVQNVSLSSSNRSSSTKKYQHIELIKKLRLQLRDLERYAYERGELDQVPASVLAERQSVILETLKERLSLRISMSEIETLKTDQLKEQIDKEIRDLIDPLITKEYLLSQLKTQLTDLERYIDHLHGTIGKIRADGSGLAEHWDESDELNNSSKHTDQKADARNTTFKTSRLIRDIIAHLICSDMKIQNRARQEQKDLDRAKARQRDNSTNANGSNSSASTVTGHDPDAFKISPVREAPSRAVKFNDGAAWTLHIDKVILATDSLINLFAVNSECRMSKKTWRDDEHLVESVVRRQLVPALRDLLSYGLIELSFMPKSTSYLSMIFDPYYVLSSLTCFLSAPKTASSSSNSSAVPLSSDKIHVWSVIEDYYQTRNEPAFQTSSVKTLSQSFNLAPTTSGPIKITSKQALLIAIDDIIGTLSKCKPDGPESRFKAFVYTALSRGRLATWLRLIFKNKSTIKKYYHSYGFVCQQEKMDKFLSTIEPLNQLDFKLSIDVETVEQYVGAFYSMSQNL